MRSSIARRMEGQDRQHLNVKTNKLNNSSIKCEKPEIKLKSNKDIFEQLYTHINEIRNSMLGQDKKKTQYRCWCPVKFNGTSTFALIDSGNVCSNCVSHEFAKKLFGQEFDLKVELFKNKHLGTANKGAKVKVIGITDEAERSQA